MAKDKTGNGNSNGNTKADETAKEIEATAKAVTETKPKEREEHLTEKLEGSTAIVPVPANAEASELGKAYMFREGTGNDPEKVMVVNIREVEALIKPLRTDFIDLEHKGASLQNRLTMLLVPYAVARTKGYVEITLEGKEISHKPAKPEATELRDFCRRVLGMNDPIIAAPDERADRLSIKPNQANNLITLACKAAYLVAAGFDGMTTAYFVGNSPVDDPENPKWAGKVVQRLAAPWNEVMPTIKVGKNDFPNPEKKLIPIGPAQINVSYAVYKDGRERDKYGRLKGEGQEPVTLASYIKACMEALQKATGDEISAHEEEIQALFKVVDSLVEGFAEKEANKGRAPLKRTA